MLLDEGNTSEEVPYEHEKADPGHTTDGIEERELREVHMAHASDEGREGAEEGHEARDDDGKTAIFLEEVIELIHAFLRERLHLARIDDALAEEARDPIIRGVAEDRRHVEDDERSRNVQTSPICGEDTCSEEQRVTWQEGKEDQAGLDEDDEEERRVDPNWSERDDPTCDERARVAQKPNEKVDDIQQAILFLRRLAVFVATSRSKNEYPE